VPTTPRTSLDMQPRGVNGHHDTRRWRDPQHLVRGGAPRRGAPLATSRLRTVADGPTGQAWSSSPRRVDRRDQGSAPRARPRASCARGVACGRRRSRGQPPCAPPNLCLPDGGCPPLLELPRAGRLDRPVHASSPRPQALPPPGFHFRIRNGLHASAAMPRRPILSTSAFHERSRPTGAPVLICLCNPLARRRRRETPIPPRPLARRRRRATVSAISARRSPVRIAAGSRCCRRSRTRMP